MPALLPAPGTSQPPGGTSRRRVSTHLGHSPSSRTGHFDLGASMPDLHGTNIESAIDRVVDGDTVAVTINGTSEKLRLSSLDTEESSPGSDKPVTPWGKEGKKRAQELLPAGQPVTLEFAGDEPVEECLRRYRDNYGRLLVWIYVGETDYQELMIRDGYSPYFNK